MGRQVSETAIMGGPALSFDEGKKRNTMKEEGKIISHNVSLAGHSVRLLKKKKKKHLCTKKKGNLQTGC